MSDCCEANSNCGLTQRRGDAENTNCVCVHRQEHHREIKSPEQLLQEANRKQRNAMPRNDGETHYTCNLAPTRGELLAVFGLLDVLGWFGPSSIVKPLH